MTTLFDRRIKRLVNSSPADTLRGGLKGVEKESLRVRPDGMLSDGPHPPALGSPLTNRYITTDFSEALLEFVTPAFGTTWETLHFLCDIHQFSYERMDDELLWATSMPCKLPAESQIPLARYGRSNVGRMKTIYRRGLGYRYGRLMQTIAGVHFNYSLPEPFWPLFREHEQRTETLQAFRSEAYLGLVRNFRRFGWLVLYLFGASPAVCKSFAGATAGLARLDGETLYEPYGTSLRMSDLGYSNRTQSKINISLNDLDGYIAGLVEAIRSPEPAFEKIGLEPRGDADEGDYRQLSVNRLQIENEYYSSIRPKRVAYSGERPTEALRRGGVEYVEIRSIDLNVFDPVGVNQNVMRFMEAFLIYCLLAESAPLDDAGLDEAARNQSLVARRGRDPGLKLTREGEDLSLSGWGSQIVEGVCAVAELLDRGEDGNEYGQAVDAQAELLAHPDATPSARLLQELHDRRSGFFAFAMDAARGHKEYFSALVSPNPDHLQHLEFEALDSHRRQKEIENSDTLSFEEYLANYFAGA
ncbi:MAG TPA: glutamate--cysteine ligase [Woeseiaceae bacterium]|nr:glutamate--cysteine ligase [Woeseiaceae bacterium]